LKNESVLLVVKKTFMKKSEIDEFLETSFKKIGKYFHKSIAGF